MTSWNKPTFPHGTNGVEDADAVLKNSSNGRKFVAVMGHTVRDMGIGCEVIGEIWALGLELADRMGEGTEREFVPGSLERKAPLLFHLDDGYVLVQVIAVVRHLYVYSSTS